MLHMINKLAPEGPYSVQHDLSHYKIVFKYLFSFQHFSLITQTHLIPTLLASNTMVQITRVHLCQHRVHKNMFANVYNYQMKTELPI